MRVFVQAGLVVLVLLAVVSCEISLWRECRSENSWLYCMRLLGPK